MLKKSFLIAGLMFAGACFAPIAQADELKKERKYSKVARAALAVNDMTWDVVLPVLFYIKYSLVDLNGQRPQRALDLLSFNGLLASMLAAFLGACPRIAIQSIIKKYDVADDQADDQKSHKEFKNLKNGKQ